jgi:hypothetical protein
MALSWARTARYRTHVPGSFANHDPKLAGANSKSPNRRTHESAAGVGVVAARRFCLMSRQRVLAP